MKLISLYVENFGGLSRFSLDFEAGLTTINRPNGFGKTTLAEFIRAMFYGFPRKSKTLDKSLRQKYAPWNGGQYSGNLVFELEGRSYRIERTFGATPKDDTFTLIDLTANRKTNRFSANIGIEIFGLDSESFERSTYLPQMGVEGPLSTASIQAKLSNLVEDSTDVANYDKAMSVLRARRIALIPYRGSGGEVAENSAEISGLQLQLDQALLQKSQLVKEREAEKQLRSQIKAEQAALEQVRQQLENATEIAATAARQRQYEDLLDQQREASREIRRYAALFPAGIPDLQALDDAEAMADRCAALMNQPCNQGNSMLPTLEEIAACRRKWDTYDALQGKIHELQDAGEQLKRQKDLLLYTRAGIPGGVIAAWILSSLTLAGGAALMILREFLYGGIGLGIGIAAAVISTVILLRRRTKQRKAEQELAGKIQSLQQEIARLKENSEEILHQIGQFLYPYYPKAGRWQFLACLTRLEQDARLAVQTREMNAQAEGCRAELEAFFSQFGFAMEQNARAQLRRLRESVRDLQAAKARGESIARQIAAFHAEFGDVALSDVSCVADLQQLRAEEQQLHKKLTELTEKLLLTQQRISLLQGEADGIGQLQEELESRQKKLAEDRENVRILDAAMEFLQQARENLSVAYLGKIRSRFGHYLSQLESSRGNYLIDTDLQVQPEQMGQARELAYFSAGQTDLIMLCMRMALVDALFREEAMFVILDDPFVNLDDAHTAQALKLLRTLSAQRQILYLTCHSSRIA